MNVPRKVWVRSAVVLALAGGLYVFSRIYTQWLWCKSVGDSAGPAHPYEDVYVKTLLTSIELLIASAVVVFAILYPNLRLSRRVPKRDDHYIGPSLFQYVDREMIDAHIDRWVLGSAALLAVFFGLMAKNRWFLFLQFTHAQPFGQTDPLFGLDASFYVFKLPFLSFVLGHLMGAVVLAIIGATLLYLYQDRIFITGGTVKVTPEVRGHLSVLIAAALVLKAGAYWLARHKLLNVDHGLYGGAGSGDVHGRIGVLTVSAVLAAACALFFLATMRSGTSVRLNGIALAVVFGFAIVAGNAYPRALQVYVKGGEKKLEMPYIERNIAATRAAYGLDQIKAAPFAADSTLTKQDLAENETTVRSIRLWDHRPLRDVYAQKEQLYPYYQFVDIDVDRYEIGGRLRQVMLSAREINVDGLPPASQTWQNRHVVYTHGYGVSMSPVDRVTSEGLPEYFLYGLPTESSGPVQLSQPGIYFGEIGQGPPGGAGGSSGSYDDRFAPRPPSRSTPQFVVVGTKVEENDYPLGADKAQTTRYAGKDGVSLSGLFRRLIFALRLHSGYLVVSPDLTAESKIILNRDIRHRIHAICPWAVLAPDVDPYISIDDKGVPFWVIDAYTRTDRYPYSSVAGRYGLNYIRNAVKITVDAYDGTTRFWVTDETDPLLKTYRSMFPALFSPLSEMPVDRQRHLRYPLMMFHIQSMMLMRYHVENSGVFYSGEQQWVQPMELHGPMRTQAGQAPAPQQPGPGQAGMPRQSEEVQEAIAMSPYYVVMDVPGQTEDNLVLMLPFTRQGRPNLAAWMGASWSPGTGARLDLFEFPENRTIWGPYQFEQKVDSDQVISQQLTLWSQGGSSVIRGNTLVIPIGGSLLYVEPLYIQAHGTQGQAMSFPALKQVICAFGDKLAMRDTLAEALEAVLGLAPPPVAVEPTTAGADGAPSAPEVTPPAPPPGPSPAPASTAREPAPSPAPPAGVQLSPELVQRLEEQLREMEESLRETRSLLRQAAPEQ